MKPVSSPPLSPRRRRLRRAIWVLSACLVAGAGLGLGAWLKYRPAAYQPGEASVDLTSGLSSRLPAEAPKPSLSDVTTRAGLGGFRNFAGERTSQIPEDMGAGIAWGDFDNDGFEDVFLVSAGGPLGSAPQELAPCALYRNNGDGTFRRVDTFPPLRIHGIGAAWGDYDGDGFLDLVVTGYGTLQLFHNERGSGKFTRDARFPDLPGFWAGAAWGDYDNDRRLDLYVCGYVQFTAAEADRGKMSQQVGTAVPFTLNPSSYPPGTNLLFHNNGDGTFTEVGAALGVRNPEGRSLSALWNDFDDDGWLDLYVANDVSDNVLYHNEHGTFRDISHPAWVADYRSAMGLAAGDFDRDGDDDLFITHWVAQENALYENLWANFAGKNGSPAPAPASSNATTRLRFTDIADMKGLGQVALPYVGWGTEFVDLDGDGWLDLVVANGSTLEIEGTRRLQPQEMFLFWNEQGRMFHDLAPLNPSLSAKHVSRGLAVADFDNDGAMDVIVSDHGEGVRLLRNEMQRGHWLKLRLQSRNAAGQPLGFGDGARAIVHLGGVALRRAVGSASYCSQSSRVLHFGLGRSNVVERLEVRWLGGGTNWFTNLTADATYLVTEDGPARPIAPPRGDTTSIRTPAPGPAAPATERERTVEFWRIQRAGMDALKRENDLARASRLFREALELNPAHEDSRYYLANCLAVLGDTAGALNELAELKRRSPQSHRAHQQWGTLRALAARSLADLAEAETSLQRAHALNPEETGALLVLGEVSVLRGDLAAAETRLAAACRTNPRATGGVFLRAYIAAARGEMDRGRHLLREARASLGPDWKPKGSTAEGDVARRQHIETTPLSPFFETWNGSDDVGAVFEPLRGHLAAQQELFRRQGQPAGSAGDASGPRPGS